MPGSYGYGEFKPEGSSNREGVNLRRGERRDTQGVIREIVNSLAKIDPDYYLFYVPEYARTQGVDIPDLINAMVSSGNLSSHKAEELAIAIEKQNHEDEEWSNGV